jgi:putative ABC transport system permease protein
MGLAADFRFGFRALRKSPGFALTAFVTMALGAGATTAIFSVTDALLWKPVPLPDLNTMVMVVGVYPDDPRAWTPTTPADTEDIRHQATTLAKFASFEYGMANVASSGAEPERVQQALATPNFFDVLRVQPALGRGFQPGEDQAGRDRVVVLTDTLWRSRFGADPNIAGKSIRLDDVDYTVIGVMPPKVEFPQATQIWTPLVLKPEQSHSRLSQLLVSVARLKPGATVKQAASEVSGIGARLARNYPDTNKNRRFRIQAAHEFLIGEYTKEYVLMLMYSVLFVLLIACVNVANLQLARATGRMREVAVRTALGARRSRIISQLVVESVLLSTGGALLGLAIANWGLNLIRAGMPPEVEPYILGWREIHLDRRTLAFTMAAAVLSGILSGLLPAWQATRPNLTEALKEGGRGSSLGRSRHRLRSLLVAAEIALAMVLLAGASLMVRSFATLIGNGKSLEPDTLLTLRLAISESKYPKDPQVTAFYRQVLELANALPGVRSAVAVTAIPYTQHSSTRYFTIEGRQLEPSNQPSALYQAVSPGYIAALHIPLRAGRWLNESDGPDGPRVAVISELLARRWFPGEALPMGKRIKIGTPDSKQPWMQIVGVVEDVTMSVWDRSPRATLYLPFLQSPSRWMDVGVRAAGDPMRLAPPMMAAIRSVDAEQPISSVRTLSTAIRQDATGLDYMAVLMGIFGLLALALSAIGVYGVMAYLVSEQTHEIGIRLALGASRGRVLGMVFRRGTMATVVGLVPGLLAAYALARILASLIFGVNAQDAPTFFGIPLLLAAAAALATYIPARRAMRTDPIVALRYE